MRFPALVIYLLCFESYDISSKSVQEYDVEVASSISKNKLQDWQVMNYQNGYVSHTEAVLREKYVVQMVEQGHWPLDIYHEYQSWAAANGNVDSFNLLIQYSFSPYLHDKQDRNRILSSESTKKYSTNCEQFNADQALLTDYTKKQGKGDQGTNNEIPPIVLASFLGCLGAIHKFINNNVNVEETGKNGVTALAAASMVGHTDIIKLLIKDGKANVNSTHKFAGSTALHAAAELSQYQSILTLCRYGIDTNARTVTDATALHIAANVGSVPSIRSLLSSPCNMGPNILMNNDTTPLYLASQHGHADAVRALLQLGASPNFIMPKNPSFNTKQNNGHLSPSHLPYKNSYGNLPINNEPGNGAQALHAAAENGHYSILPVLISAGADIDSVTIGGTALVIAVQHYQPYSVQTLLELGANTEIPTVKDGLTALFYACGLGFKDITIMLLNYKANPDTQHPTNDLFPLWNAVKHSHYHIVQLLIKKGANLNLRIQDGTTAVFLAIQQGDLKSIKLFLSQGVDLTLSGYDNRSILHEAVLSSKKNKHILPLLLSHINETGLAPRILELRMSSDGINNNGPTPLLLACQHGLPDAVKALLGAGADPSLRISSGGHNASCLHLAVESGDAGSLEHILNMGVLDPDLGVEGPKPVTPLLMAIERGYEKIVGILLVRNSHRKGADPNKGLSGVQAGVYQSPILLSVLRSTPKTTKILLDAGASCDLILSVSDGQFLNLLDLARQKRDFDTVQILLNHKNCDFN